MPNLTADFIVQTFYRAEKLTYLPTPRPYPMLADKVLKFKKRHYGRSKPFLWLDIPHGKAIREASRQF